MRRYAIFMTLALLSACSTAPGPQPVQTNQALPSAPRPTSSAPVGAEPKTDAPKQANDAEVAELKAKYEKSPNDAAIKKEYADALFQSAEFYMYSSPLPPNQKYPKALALYRETLKLDPTNTVAKESIDTIESIYRSMNRPIPDGSKS